MDKKTVVIGASMNPDRYSNKAIHKLLANNIEVEAIGVKPGKIGPVAIKTDLLLFKNVHTVTMYVNPKIQKQYYNYLVQLSPKRVIFNPGTENSELAEELLKNGIEFENACTLVLLATHQY